MWSGSNLSYNPNSLFVKISLIKWLFPLPELENIPNLIGLLPANIYFFVGVTESINYLIIK